MLIVIAKQEAQEIVMHVPLVTHNQEVQNVIYVPMDIILIELKEEMKDNVVNNYF